MAQILEAQVEGTIVSQVVVAVNGVNKEPVGHSEPLFCPLFVLQASFDVVDRFAEEIWQIEDEYRQHEQHHAEADHILRGVIGAERNGVFRALDIDAERIVRFPVMQRP